MLQNLRNAAIVLLMAAAVWAVPGGDDAGRVVARALSAAFMILIVWALMRVYRDHRVAIYSLGNVNRAILYCSLAAIVVATAALADGKLDDAYVLVWFVVMCAAAVGLYRVWRYHREYGY